MRRSRAFLIYITLLLVVFGCVLFSQCKGAEPTARRPWVQKKDEAGKSYWTQNDGRRHYGYRTPRGWEYRIAYEDTYIQYSGVYTLEVPGYFYRYVNRDLAYSAQQVSGGGFEVVLRGSGWGGGDLVLTGFDSFDAAVAKIDEMRKHRANRDAWLAHRTAKPAPPRVPDTPSQEQDP